MYIPPGVLLIVEEVVVVVVVHIGVLAVVGVQLAGLNKELKDDGTNLILGSAGANLADEMLDRVVVADPK